MCVLFVYDFHAEEQIHMDSAGTIVVKLVALDESDNHNSAVVEGI